VFARAIGGARETIADAAALHCAEPLACPAIKPWEEADHIKV
jgi:hypothetical protein